MAKQTFLETPPQRPEHLAAGAVIVRTAYFDADQEPIDFDPADGLPPAGTVTAEESAFDDAGIRVHSAIYRLP